MTGSRLRSRLGAILATALFTVALVPGLATAANTRDLDISMSVTKVSVPATGTGPNATKVEVSILNSGTENLAHTVLAIDWNNKDLAGLSLNTYYDPDGGDDASSTFCSTSDTVITCDYGSLGAGASRTVAVIVNVSSAFTATTTTDLFRAVATTNNENGSNVQLFPVTSGAFKVTPLNANALFTYLLGGANPTLFTSNVGGDGGNLSTNVKFNNSNNELVAISEGTSSVSLYPCPSGLSCQPDYSEVTTTSGTFDTTPFFTWKLTALVPKTYTTSQGFLAHSTDGGATYDWILYFKDKSAACGTDIEAKIASQGHCIKTLSLTKFDKTFNLLVVESVMDHQGGLKY